MKPPRDARYLTWVRSLPCLLRGRGCAGPVEAHHIRTDGMGQKCSDYETVPLCAVGHHKLGGQSAHHLGRKEFERRHGIDLAAEANRLQIEWRSEKQAA